MNNKILLSFAVPTYNRAGSLEKLFNNVLPQAREFKDEVEICVSNNGSTDNTKAVVLGFQKKYPDLTIRYRENEKNLGVDANILNVVQMCEGDFIWTFGDDDSIKAGGLNTVINFVKNSCNKDTGLAVLRVESYAIDKKTGQKIIFTNTLDKNKSEIFKIDKKDIIGLTYPAIAFISVLIFNNKFLKKMMAEDLALIERGIGTCHIHIFLIVLMFLKYPYINGIAFNKDIVCQEMPRYKFFIEDKFILHYRVQKRLNHLLVSNKYMSDDYAPLVVKNDRVLIQGFIIDMIGMKVFKSFNYFSYSGCLKLFFKSSKFLDALIFSFIFSALLLTPSMFLIILYKSLLMFKYGKNWKLKWNSTNDLYSIISGGSRRRNELPD